MITDKDYIIRLVRQFSEFLSKMILDKNDGETTEEKTLFDTQMKDCFGLSIEDLLAMSKEDIIHHIETDKQPHHQADFFQTLGHLFYHQFMKNPSIETADKAKTFYEIWLQKSSTFSLAVMGRVKELSEYINS